MKAQNTIMLLILTLLSIASAEQTFDYTISDVLLIPYNKSVDISNSLATASYESIKEKQVQINIQLQQTSINGSPFIYYNILYFDLADTQGNKCYYDYFSLSILPQTVYDCNSTQANDTQGVGCVIFSNCYSSPFNYNQDLVGINYQQNIIIIQNNHPLSNNSILNISSQVSIMIYNNNIWFYGSVALTCCLLLILVLLTGIALYWSLKYKQAKRTLQEMRLTEVDAETSSLHKSLRQSMMKSQ